MLQNFVCLESSKWVNLAVISRSFLKIFVQISAEFARKARSGKVQQKDLSRKIKSFSLSNFSP